MEVFVALEVANDPRKGHQTYMTRLTSVHIKSKHFSRHSPENLSVFSPYLRVPTQGSSLKHRFKQGEFGKACVIGKCVLDIGLAIGFH